MNGLEEQRLKEKEFRQMSGKERALEMAVRYGGIEGDHHRAWVIDQIVRAITNCPIERESAIDFNGISYEYDFQGESQEYLDFVASAKDGVDGPETYEWEEGIAP